MEFYAGFVGILQNHETKSLTPSIGWAIRDKTSSTIDESNDND